MIFAVMISALDFEHEYVHTAYELLAQILESGAPKIWPFVDDFIDQFQSGSIIVDVGCGEGKYLRHGTGSWMIGTDRSFSLSEICQANRNEVATCDITKMAFRDSICDGIICISVIHHLATEARRVRALKELARILRPGGRMLITAWALENEYRKFICQDVLVPAEVARIEDKHCLKADSVRQSSFRNIPVDFIKDQATSLTTKLGGIHDLLCKEVEALKLKLRTASNVTDTIQNYFINRKRSIWLWVEDRTLLNKLGHIFRTNLRKTHSSNDLASSREEGQNHTKRGCYNRTHDVTTTKVADGIHRYYHVFQKGELARLVQDNVPGLEVCDEWFEQGNWVVVARKRCKKDSIT